MADTNTPGSLLVGEGVFMKGSMRVPGLASIDGKLEGELTADTVHIQTNGSMNGRTTASHVRVAGAVTDTTIANKTLVIESSGLIAGSITYTDLEIKKEVRMAKEKVTERLQIIEDKVVEDTRP
jgi:cytoskeletal protein CcmA (bactofilin family)